MIQPNRKFPVLVILLLPVLAVLSGCSGGGEGGVVGTGPLPAAPTGLTVTVSSGHVVLQWNAVPNASRYRVYFEYSPGLTKTTGIPLTSPSGIASTSYTHQPLTNGATYYYVVTALNNYNQEGPNSAEISAKLAVPAAPATVLATASSNTTNAWVSVSWTGIPEAVTYSVLRSITAGTSYNTISTGIVATSLTDTNVTTEIPYYYVIKAVNSFGTGSASTEATATPIAGALPDTLTVSGKVRYEDKEYQAASPGFTGNTSFKAVRFSKVELAYTSTTGVVTGTTDTTTTADGSYTITVPSTQAGNSVYVRAISLSTPATSQSIAVKDLSGQLYAVKTASFTLAGNTSINLSIPVTNQADSAFNILDTFTNGFQFVDSLSGSPPALSLNAFWEVNNLRGTYYCDRFDATWCPQNAGIYILSDPFGQYPDTDDFDDDVLLHELGHFMADKLSKDQSPGGTHYLNRNDYDLRLTWSEGWGNFFQSAAKYWINVTDPSLLSSIAPLSAYVDTEVGAVYLTVDIAAPDDPTLSPYCFGTCTHATNEIAVANVLWNSMTGTANLGMPKVWDIFHNVLPTATPPNLEAFWDGWMTRNPADLTALKPVYLNREIQYWDDTYEPGDNGSGSAILYTTDGAAQTHTLYSALLGPVSGDIDYGSFTVTAGNPYTITTSSLLNGADTIIRVLGPDAVTEIAKNDNLSGTSYTAPFNCNPTYGDCHENGNDLLASKITLSSAVTNSWGSGNYFIEVTSSSNRPLSAGRYGTYTMKVTQP
jgi:hypothetical protein